MQAAGRIRRATPGSFHTTSSSCLGCSVWSAFLCMHACTPGAQGYVSNCRSQEALLYLYAMEHRDRRAGSKWANMHSQRTKLLSTSWVSRTHCFDSKICYWYFSSSGRSASAAVSPSGVDSGMHCESKGTGGNPHVLWYDHHAGAGRWAWCCGGRGSWARPTTCGGWTPQTATMPGTVRSRRRGCPGSTGRCLAASGTP